MLHQHCFRSVLVAGLLMLAGCASASSPDPAYSNCGHLELCHGDHHHHNARHHHQEFHPPGSGQQGNTDAD